MSKQQNYLALWYHLIWATKHRLPFIQRAWKWELYGRMRDFCETKGYHLDFINGIEDHVHLLLSPKPQYAISDIVRDIKRDSYFWVKEKGFCGDEFGWQDGYGALTVSPSQVDAVRNYISHQEVHHRQISFEDELNKIRQIVHISHT
ncbi:IS200/IS605 family transposase [Rhodoflexus caldus]|uniref:IS200/IS605 family transposase n=1 Tax=Rhodoflexus caldus TaxID=2891236 RepID=UPI00202A2D91|nr:IS200/IS605 family transposase [Rhodoflexus caldus]